MSKVDDLLKEADYPCWCGHREAKFVCGQSFGRRPFAVLACRACGTQRILPKALPNQTSAEVLYNEYQGPDIADYGEERFTEAMLRRIRETDLQFRVGQKVLDVGCGSGLLLETVCANFGVNGTGIDVDRRRITKATARAKHARFECGLFAAEQLGDQFDVVLCTAVIEHVVDPVNFLNQLALALPTGGQLFLLTPNAGSLNYKLLRSWWRDLLSVGEHIYLFTLESLQQCAARAGFQLVKSSSGFDWSPPRLQFKGPKSSLITLWAWYRELVKRCVSAVAACHNRDILYAHFRKL